MRVKQNSNSKAVHAGTTRAVLSCAWGLDGPDVETWHDLRCDGIENDAARVLKWDCFGWCFGGITVPFVLMCVRFGLKFMGILQVKFMISDLFFGTPAFLYEFGQHLGHRASKCTEIPDVEGQEMGDRVEALTPVEIPRQERGIERTDTQEDPLEGTLIWEVEGFSEFEGLSDLGGTGIVADQSREWGGEEERDTLAGLEKEYPVRHIVIEEERLKVQVATSNSGGLGFGGEALIHSGMFADGRPADLVGGQSQRLAGSPVGTMSSSTRGPAV
ncbi:hypothetical protein GIB67_031796 [Kingdonia uniflora]|uniref:Uncharacterized protein n=1 Tax=Kingdonia uniflora TaxID=39325 RepID=A0A7J7L4I7_9MAGN|nr:hypothetical protein GIB67_031796 [Kingdonia uniflora]